MEEEGEEEEGVVEEGEGEDREGGVEELTGTAVRGLEGGTLVFVHGAVSFWAWTGLLGCAVGTVALGGSDCTCICMYKILCTCTCSLVHYYQFAYMYMYVHVYVRSAAYTVQYTSKRLFTKTVCVPLYPTIGTATDTRFYRNTVYFLLHVLAAYTCTCTCTCICLGSTCIYR